MYTYIYIYIYIYIYNIWTVDRYIEDINIVIDIDIDRYRDTSMYVYILDIGYKIRVLRCQTSKMESFCENS